MLGIAIQKMKLSSMAIYIVISVTAFFTLLPFLFLISGSLTSEKEILNHGFSLIPRKFDLYAYEYILYDYQKILNAYGVTIFVTVVGTVASVMITALMAYPIARPDLKYRNYFAFYVFLTMLFNGGMVPWYIVCRNLQLIDNIWALIFPYIINAWNVMLLRNFFKTIPASLYESAYIDGAGEWRIFFRIVMPLSKPGLATVTLFIALSYWNDWWLGLMLLNKHDLYPLQLLLRTIVSNVQFLATASSQITGGVQRELPTLGVRMSTTMITIGPIIFLYTFLQKYFIKGIIIGAVKG